MSRMRKDRELEEKAIDSTNGAGSSKVVNRKGRENII